MSSLNNGPFVYAIAKSGATGSGCCPSPTPTLPSPPLQAASSSEAIVIANTAARLRNASITTLLHALALIGFPSRNEITAQTQNDASTANSERARRRHERVPLTPSIMFRRTLKPMRLNLDDPRIMGIDLCTCR